MTVESVTYIDDLNASYPAGTDVKSEGDNHIRNIKTALKNTFSAVAGEVTADHAELSLLEGKEGMGLTLKGYQTYTSGSGIYTTPAGVKALYVELIGGGGGGGGAKGNGAGTAAAASGGGGGGYCAKLITSPAATYAYAVGAGDVLWRRGVVICRWRICWRERQCDCERAGIAVSRWRHCIWR